MNEGGFAGARAERGPGPEPLAGAPIPIVDVAARSSRPRNTEP